jgi:hypothetical protein
MKNRRRSSTFFGSNAGLLNQWLQMVVGFNYSILFYLLAGDPAGADDRYLLVAIAK